MSVTGSGISIAKTILEYFNPAKSPFYSVVAFSTLSLGVIVALSPVHWEYGVYPIYITLFVSVLYSLKDDTNMSIEEYNDQLRFARVFAISAACLAIAIIVVFAVPSQLEQQFEGGVGEQSVEEEGPVDLASYPWVTSYNVVFYVPYTCAVIQIILYFMFIFVYHSHNTKIGGPNFIQHALIMSTLILGMAAIARYVSVFGTQLSHFIFYEAVIIVLYGEALLWFICAYYTFSYLKRNVRFLPPRDAAQVEFVEQADP